MRNPFEKTKLEDLGVSTKRALELHRKQIERGAFDFDISGDPVPKILNKSNAKDAGSSTTVHAPTGDGERVWVTVRANAKLHKAFGFGFDVLATARGPYEASVYTTKIGEIDDDGLFVPVKEN